MASQVKLTFGGTDYIVMCNNVTPAGKVNNVSKPNANGTTAVSIQTQSFENPTYSLQGVELTEASGTLTYAVLLSMYRNKYNGSNGITLTVDYGKDSTKLLIGSDGSTTAIPVVIESFNFPIGINKYSNYNSHTLTGSIVLRETA